VTKRVLTKDEVRMIQQGLAKLGSSAADHLYGQLHFSDGNRLVLVDETDRDTLFVDGVIDFDGVCHTYDHWRDGSLYGDPIEGSVEGMWTLVRQGKKLAVSTARADTPERLQAVVEWLAKHGYPPVPVTNLKPVAFFYLDDRGIRFVDWTQALADIDKVLNLGLDEP